MTSEEARVRYEIYASQLRMATVAHGKQKWLHRPQDRCRSCQEIALDCDAASLAYDLAVAQESEDRIRASVAWA